MHHIKNHAVCTIDILLSHPERIRQVFREVAK